MESFYWITGINATSSVHFSFQIKDAGGFPHNRVFRITGGNEQVPAEGQTKEKRRLERQAEKKDDVATTWQ